jgi:hypothetical protein
MELQFENKSIQYLRPILRESKELEQTQEVRLPEGMPDIGSILGVWGQCVMRSKEWNGDHFIVSGGVMAWVLYAPADGSAPRSMETWLPIQMKWNMGDGHNTGHIRCQWLLKAADGRMLSARKMMLRANVSILAEAMEPGEESIALVENVPEDVQLLKHTYPTRLPVEMGEKSFLIDHEWDMNAPEGEKLICCRVCPEITEQKVLGDKVVFRGNCHIHMLLQGADGGLVSQDWEESFSQFTELDREYDKDAGLDMTLAISSLEPELQEGRVRLKCGLVSQYQINDLRMLELVEDAYSPLREVTMEQRQLRLPMLLDRQSETMRYECAIGENVGQVVDVTVHADQPEIRRSGELTQINCGGQMQVLYMDDLGALQGRSCRWSSGWELPASPETELLVQLRGMPRPLVSVSAGQIAINGEAQMEVQSRSQVPMTMVTGLELGDAAQPDPGRPSLILCRAGAASLWEIAKSSGSTVQAIRQANGLSGEPLDDRMLLIPVV